MSTITIRGLDEVVAKRLKQMAASSRLSVNKLVVKIIETSVFSYKRRERTYDDLDFLFGKWSQKESEQLIRNIQSQRKIEDEIWK